MLLIKSKPNKFEKYITKSELEDIYTLFLNEINEEINFSVIYKIIYCQMIMELYKIGKI